MCQAQTQPEGNIEERVAALLEPAEVPADELLSIVLPVVEYAGTAALDALPRSLVHVARQTSLAETQSSLPFLAATLVVGRLGWAIAAYALHCRRLDAVTSAWRAALPSRYEDQLSPPLLADPSLRHPDVFERHAGKGYADYRGWVESRELIQERYPLFVAELAEVFAEADFILALRAAAAVRWEIYSEGLTGATVGRFHALHLSEESALLLTELATAALRHNPRRVKEFVGNLELQLRVIEAREAAGALNPPIHEDVLLAAKVQLLLEEWPDRYDVIWRDYRVLNQWHDDIPAQRYDGIPGGVDDRFRAFINVSRSVSNHNLRPFLTLKQAQEEAELPRFPEFLAAIVEGQTARVDQLVSASQVAPAAWAARLEPLLREETRRRYVAGARNLIETVLSSETLATGPHIKRLLQFASDTAEIRQELRNAAPDVVIPASSAHLDDLAFNRLIEPFLAVHQVYEESPERARLVIEQLVPVVDRLDPSRRALLEASLADARIAANFELMQPIVDAEPDLVPEQAAEAALDAVTEGAPPDQASPGFVFTRSWLKRSSVSVVQQDRVLGIVRSGLTALIDAQGAEPSEAAAWMAAATELLTDLSGPSPAEVELLATQLVAIDSSTDADLQSRVLDLVNPVLEWIVGTGSPPQAEALAEAYYTQRPAEMVTYVEEKQQALRPRLRWALHRRLTQVLLSAANPEELRLRAAAAINKVDPSDREEELGGAIPKLIRQGDLELARTLATSYSSAADLYRPSIAEAALEYADGQIPAIPRPAYDLLESLLAHFGAEEADRLRDILIEQITSEGATEENSRAAFRAADDFAPAGFEERREEIVRAAFDAFAGAESPNPVLLDAVVRRAERLDADRRQSLLAQLQRWIRTPGASQSAAASGVRSFEGATATERRDLVSALVDSETAAVGEPELRHSLLDAAIALQGRAGSRAAKRVESRIQSLMNEDTEENQLILVRLGLREQA